MDAGTENSEGNLTGYGSKTDSRNSVLWFRKEKAQELIHHPYEELSENNDENNEKKGLVYFGK